MRNFNITKNLWKTIWDFTKKIWLDESGYYYAEYKEEPNGKKRIIIGDPTLIVLVLCITLLLLSVIVLSYKAGLLSQAITLFIILSMVGLVGLIIFIGKFKILNFNLNFLLWLMVLLCLVILGLNAREIKYLFEGLFSGLKGMP